ncbi:biotin/lipoyl-binding protein, partial [Candidatus Gracilibacteria bacterium]|nr:biotin/lipoyl-binding protein [Candidatus Gracilibacteria bacterium]
MTTVPQTSPKRRSRAWLPILIAVVLISAVVGTLIYRNVTTTQSDPLQGGVATPVTVETLTLGISATGQVEPVVQAELAFIGAAGRVSEVLVAEGEVVQLRDALVQLDTRQLLAEVQAAEANVLVAQADLEALREGATPEQVAEAQASINYTTSSGTFTDGTAYQLQTPSYSFAVTPGCRQPT